MAPKLHYNPRMDPDDQVCLCYRVSLRKIRTYLDRENPPVASLISECLDAVMPAIPYCIDLIGGPYIETDEAVIKVFRPKSALRNKG